MHLAPQNIPHAINVLTLGNKVIVCIVFGVCFHQRPMRPLDPCICSYHIRLWLVGFLAFCLLSHVLVSVMVCIILFRSAAYTDLAYFRQLPCAIYILFPVVIQKVFERV